MADPRSLKRARRHTKERVARGMGQFWIGLAKAVFYPLTMLLARVRVSGLGNVPAEGGAILVLNHVSHLDPVYDAVMVHRAARVPRFLAKNTLWNVPVLSNVLRGVEQIPVYRGAADAQRSLLEAHKALTEGKVILIYPDGTITKDPDGWPMTPKVGVARLALDHDVPVIPIARWGTRGIYDHYQKKFRPLPRKQVHYRIGEPVDLSDYRGVEVTGKVLREVTTIAMSRVRALLSEIRSEPEPAGFYSSARKAVDKDGDD